MMDGGFFMDVVLPGTTKVLSVGYAQDTVVCWVRSKPLDSGDPRISKHVTQILSEVKSRTSTLRLVLRGKNKVDQEAWVLYEYNLGIPDIVKHRSPGVKYLVIEIRDSVVTELWEVSRLLVVGEQGAGRR